MEDDEVYFSEQVMSMIRGGAKGWDLETAREAMQWATTLDARDRGDRRSLLLNSLLEVADGLKIEVIEFALQAMVGTAPDESKNLVVREVAHIIAEHTLISQNTFAELLMRVDAIREVNCERNGIDVHPLRRRIAKEIRHELLYAYKAALIPDETLLKLFNCALADEECLDTVLESIACHPHCLDDEDDDVQRKTTDGLVSVLLLPDSSAKLIQVWARSPTLLGRCSDADINFCRGYVSHILFSVTRAAKALQSDCRGSEAQRASNRLRDAQSRFMSLAQTSPRVYHYLCNELGAYEADPDHSDLHHSYMSALRSIVPAPIEFRVVAPSSEDDSTSTEM